jgi:hypothetical protein
MVAVDPEKLAKTGRQKAERPATLAFALAGAARPAKVLASRREKSPRLALGQWGNQRGSA